MGDLWLADECSFIDVTIGLARLQQVVRELSPSFEPELAEARPTRRALLLTAPGEQHTLGVSMVEQFFRRAGWEVAAPPKGEASAVNLVRKEWFTMVGFSVSCVELLDGLQSTIRSLRHTSRNPDLIVMVGGNAFIDQPDLVSRVGADAMAADGRQAVLGLNGLLSSARAPAQPTRAKANWKRNGASGLTRYGSPV
jgi:methanogenic corrinoid protein MtbC1